METDFSAFFRRINATPHKLCAAITGGGTGLFGKMLASGGASNTVLYAFVPYDQHFTNEYLHNPPEYGYCHPETARELAMRAYINACNWKWATKSDNPVIGIGGTSSLAKIGNERIGRQHKIYIVLQTETKTNTYELEFPISKIASNHDRSIEENINDRMLLNAILDGCEINDYCPLITNNGSGYDLSDFVKEESIIVPYTVVEVLHKKVDFAVYPSIIGKKPRVISDPVHPKLILPTSCNPLHDAHIHMAKVAEDMTGLPCYFELCLYNADKPPVDYHSLEDRVEIFRKKDLSNGCCILTHTPLFGDKVKIFGPNVTFAIGADTAIRICQEKYYGSYENMMRQLTYMKEMKTKFLCFCRGTKENYIQVPSYSKLVQLGMVELVSPDVHISDLSSARMREEQRKKHHD